MVKLLLFFGFFATVLLSVGQESRKYGFELENYLNTAHQEEMIPLLVEGHPQLIQEHVKKWGGQVRLQMEDLFSLEIPALNVELFAAEDGVFKLEFTTTPGRSLGDTMLINTNTDSIIQQHLSTSPTPSGANVLVGFIDSGIELNHPDFQDSLGRTRVLHVWDQSVSFDPSRQAEQYNYGVEWDSSEINLGISTHDDQASEFGHGSNVAGVAVSNGNAKGNFKGIAPNANIIAVATDYSKLNWLQTVAEAVDYIYTKADSLGMPCVINASVGTYRGSHDGLDIAARMIDRMIKAKNGRSMVCAAGNAGTFSFHLRHELQQDTLFTWFENNPAQWAGRGGYYYEVWSDTSDLENLQFSFGMDKIGQSGYQFRGRTPYDSIDHRLNTITVDSLFSTSGNLLGIVQTYAEESQGRYKIEVAMIDPDSSDYRLRFQTKGTGKLDIWSSVAFFRHNNMTKSNLPSKSLFPEMRFYQKPDSFQTMVSSFSCLPSVITVGNYVNRGSYVDVTQTKRYSGVQAGSISVNSSLGPNRRDQQKPDISSSGDYMFSAGRLSTIQSAILSNPSKVSKDSLHFRNGGTSMASPTVAGMVALLLEKCPEANQDFILSELIQHARKDQFTPIQTDYKWGHGKADAFQLLKNNLIRPKLIPPSKIVCEGDSILLQLSGAYSRFKWNNGDTSSTTMVTVAGDYYVSVTDSNGCRAFSDTLTVGFLPKPNPLKIKITSDTLQLPLLGGSYQWFRNQFPISQANSNEHIATLSGDYYCEYTDTNGCAIFSDTVNFLLTDLNRLENIKNSFLVYPNPTHEELFIETQNANTIYEISLYNINGKRLIQLTPIAIKQRHRLNLGQLLRGNYMLRIVGENGVHHQTILIE